MELFKNTYRTKSHRLRNWDYSNTGYYYITICTSNKKKFFGEIVQGNIELTNIGKIIQTEWLKSFEMRKELSCDIYVIMPNHIHAILILTNQEMYIPQLNKQILMKPKSISSFVSGFKSSVTKEIRYIKQISNFKVWQKGYYDHIIRNEIELEKIREYIHDNPLNWEFDENYL